MSNSVLLNKGPLDDYYNGEEANLPSHIVATMMLCIISAFEKSQLDILEDCQLALAFDLGLATKIAEEKELSVVDIFSDVLHFYNDKLEINLSVELSSQRLAYHYQLSQSSTAKKYH